MHCSTCTCEPKSGVHLCVYPPNRILYGSCETCGQVHWQTELARWSARGGWMPVRSLHCGCCAHPHDLQNGGHDFTVRQWKARQMSSKESASA